LWQTRHPLARLDRHAVGTAATRQRYIYGRRNGLGTGTSTNRPITFKLSTKLSNARQENVSGLTTNKNYGIRRFRTTESA
jgi:hypothetical protein